MSDRPLTPSEAHRRLVEIEREKDKTRYASPPSPAHPTQRIHPRRRIISGDVVSEETESGEVLRLAGDDYTERLTRRKTVALSARELLTILDLMDPEDNMSNWIRHAILQRIARDNAERERRLTVKQINQTLTTGRED